MKEEKTIELPIVWIKGMKRHADELDKTLDCSLEMNRLLGYLSSLYHYLEEDK